METSLTVNLILQKTKLSKLSYVKKLNVCNAQLTDIDVIRHIPNAEAISLSANSIRDLVPLRECKSLTELYLRRNEINDILQVLHLSKLKRLTRLSMSENPISSDSIYRQFIISAIPSLRVLDDVEVSPEERKAAERAFPDAPYMEPPKSVATFNDSVHQHSSNRPVSRTKDEKGGSTGSRVSGGPVLSSAMNTSPSDGGGGSSKVLSRTTSQGHLIVSDPSGELSVRAASKPRTPGPENNSFEGRNEWDETPVGGSKRAAAVNAQAWKEHPRHSSQDLLRTQPPPSSALREEEKLDEEEFPLQGMDRLNKQSVTHLENKGGGVWNEESKMIEQQEHSNDKRGGNEASVVEQKDSRRDLREAKTRIPRLHPQLSPKASPTHRDVVGDSFQSGYGNGVKSSESKLNPPSPRIMRIEHGMVSGVKVLLDQMSPYSLIEVQRYIDWRLKSGQLLPLPNSPW